MAANSSRRGRYVVIALVIAVIASLWRTTSIEGEKHRIEASYLEAQKAVNELQTDRDELTADLDIATRSLEASNIDISRLHNELDVIQSKLDDTVIELASLQRDHENLRQTNSSLSDQLSSVTDEKQQLEARLGDIKELRLAIKDVKRRMSDERWAAWRAKAQALRAEDQRRLAAGNRGFMVKNGTSTVDAAARMHVKVLEPESASE